MTVDNLFEAHESGDITKHELFVHLFLVLTPSLVGPLRARLRAEGRYLAEIEEWVDDVAAGARLSLGGDPVELSEESIAAVALWRDQTRPARYATLDERVKQWISGRADVEVGVEPGDVQPFVSKDVEQLLTEAA